MASTLRMVALLLPILCTMVLIMVVFQRSVLLDDVSYQPHSPIAIPLANKLSTVDATAFVFLGLGPQAYQMNCPAAVESLVKHGGWGGDVYLITDRESCFDSEQIVRNAGMEKDKFHLEVLDEDFGGGGIDVLNPKMGFVKNRMRSKSMKTHLFDIVSDPAIEIIAYVDCDVLFAQEDCPAALVRNVRNSWKEEKIFFKKVNMDDHDHIIGLHTGTIVMHREHSKEALQLWREELEKANSPLDRIPYLAAYHRIRSGLKTNHSNSSSGSSMDNSTEVGASVTSHLRAQNPMTPGETVILVNGTKVRYEKFLSNDRSSKSSEGGVLVSCINHISKAQCEAQGRTDVQAFVDRFHLQSHGDGAYWYCPSPILTPLLYGWFPFSYLPFCPKIEQLL